MELVTGKVAVIYDYDLFAFDIIHIKEAKKGKENSRET